jgi:hypothetical protein
VGSNPRAKIKSCATFQEFVVEQIYRKNCIYNNSMPYINSRTAPNNNTEPEGAMKLNETIQYSDLLTKVGKPVAYFPRIAEALNCVPAAIFLCQFLYWEGKQVDPEGWIYKTGTDIQKETGLKRSGQETARKKLIQLGLMEEERRGIPAKMYYKFDWNRFNELLGQYFEEKEESPKKDVVPTVLYQMKEVFDKFYTEEYPIGFQWKKDKKGGDHWSGLNKLKACFEERLKVKKIQALGGATEAGILISDEEIINSFTHFLSSLPKYYKEKHYTPMGLYGRFNEIVRDVQNLKKTNGEPAATQTDRHKKNAARAAG